jgi:hypothetical protein
MSRGGIKVTRADYTSDILDALESKLNSKTAVEVARERQSSVYDQISAIVGNKVNHHTVESKVKELAERTGLSNYLNRAKTAQDSLFNFKDKDKVLLFIKNKIESNKGHVDLPAIQHDLSVNFGKEGLTTEEIYSENVAKYIGNLLKQEKSKNPPETVNNNLGKDEAVTENPNDGDFFKGMMPINK